MRTDLVDRELEQAPDAASDDPAACVAERGLAVEQVVFGGSRFLAWTLGPVALIAAAGFLATVEPAWSVATGLRVLLAVCLLCFAAALWAPRRCAFAVRLVAAIVFALCAGYLADAALFPTPLAAGKGHDPLPDAIKAFVVFGVPSFWLAVRGLRRRRG